MSKATLLLYILTLINKHATVHHLHHSYRFVSLFFFGSFVRSDVRCDIFMCSLIYRFDSLCYVFRLTHEYVNVYSSVWCATHYECRLFFSTSSEIRLIRRFRLFTLENGMNALELGPLSYLPSEQFHCNAWDEYFFSLKVSNNILSVTI